MTAITGGYVPGCIGRIAQPHAAHRAASNGFGVAFETKVASESNRSLLAYETGRDGLRLARGDDDIAGSIAVDGSPAGRGAAGARVATSARAATRPDPAAVELPKRRVVRTRS